MTEESNLYATFWEHVDDLRSILLRIALIVACGVTTALVSYQPLFKVFTAPFEADFASGLQRHEIRYERVTNTTPSPMVYELSKGRVFQTIGEVQTIDSNHFKLSPGAFIDIEIADSFKQLAILGPLDGLTMILKFSFWVGLVGTAPIWIFFVVKFITPALHKHERRMLLPWILLSLVFFGLGCSFAYLITIPFANYYLAQFNQGLGVDMWSIASYGDYTLFLMLANGLAFELCLAIFWLVHMGIVTAETLSTYRRYAIVVIFILAALLTPPDVITQLLLAVPLCGVYELAILYAKTRRV